MSQNLLSYLSYSTSCSTSKNLPYVHLSNSNLIFNLLLFQFLNINQKAKKQKKKKKTQIIPNRPPPPNSLTLLGGDCWQYQQPSTTASLSSKSMFDISFFDILLVGIHDHHSSSNSWLVPRHGDNVAVMASPSLLGRCWTRVVDQWCLVGDVLLFFFFF